MRIQELINERARYAKAVGEAKMRSNGDGPVDFYRPEREAQVLRGVTDRNDGPLSDEEIVRLFRELMSVCLAQEEPVKVGYLGPEGNVHPVCRAETLRRFRAAFAVDYH